MASRTKPGRACLVAAMILIAAGCASVKVNTRQELGLPVYAATDPAAVEILRAPPARPHTRIGVVTLEPTGDVPVEKLNDKLRQAAAGLGADAVVLRSDRLVRAGLSTPGLRYGGRIAPEMQRQIEADAIKFTEQTTVNSSADEFKNRLRNRLERR